MEKKIDQKTKEYVKHYVISNVSNLRNLSIIVFMVFFVYSAIFILIKDVVSDTLKSRYMIIYSAIIAEALCFLALTSFNKIKLSIKGSRVISLLYLFMMMQSFVALTLFDVVNSNEMSAFIIVLIVVAIIYKESSPVIVSLLMLTCLSLIGGLFIFSKNPIDAIEIVDIFVYTSIAIVLAIYENRKYLKNFSISLKLKDKTDELEVLSFKDSLTGLFNRRYLFYTLENEIKRFNRYSTPFSILLVDIDFFKKVNDTYGHLTGDSVLVEFASIALEVCRGEDIVSRYGGEEFVMVLIGASLENAVIAAERIRRSVEEYGFHNVPKKITISIGVAEIRKAEDIETVIKRADEKLYEVKNNGRNQIGS